MLIQQILLQSVAGLPLLSQLSLGVAVLRLLPARFLLCLVQLALQRADPLGHLEKPITKLQESHNKTTLYVTSNTARPRAKPVSLCSTAICVKLCVCITRSFCSLAILCSSSIWSLSSLILLSSLVIVFVRAVLFLCKQTHAFIWCHSLSPYRNSVCQLIPGLLPLLGPQKVLQLLHSTFRPGDDILLDSGALQVLHLQTQLTQLHTGKELH